MHVISHSGATDASGNTGRGGRKRVNGRVLEKRLMCVSVATHAMKRVTMLMINFSFIPAH